MTDYLTAADFKIPPYNVGYVGGGVVSFFAKAQNPFQPNTLDAQLYIMGVDDAVDNKPEDMAIAVYTLMQGQRKIIRKAEGVIRTAQVGLKELQALKSKTDNNGDFGGSRA